MNPNFNIGSLFGGTVQRAPDGSFISTGTGQTNLGDDNAVMMIDGLRGGPSGGTVQAVADSQPKRETKRNISTISLDLQGLLKTTLRIGNLEIPVWVALLIAAGALGVAGYFFFYRKGK